MSDSIWDDPEIFVSDDYVRFDNEGDTISGTITTIRRHTFDDGKVVPQLQIDTGHGERTVTAGQVRLKAALAEKRPGVGDRITITLDKIEKRAGGKTLKHFTVTVGDTPAAPAAPAAGEGKPDPLANLNLTPEAMAAIRNLL